MREIKFRAWDGREFEYFELDRKTLIRSNWKLQQYTGLKDKNWKEIYEGDIVATWGDLNPAVISMEMGYWNATLIYDSECGRIAIGHEDTLKRIKVIGNIHENPELMKE